MTESDLAKIKFRMVSHLNMGAQHTCIYESIDHIPTIIMHQHTKLRKSGVFGKPSVRYMFNSKVYQIKKKFLEAMTAFEEERKSKFEKE